MSQSTPSETTRAQDTRQTSTTPKVNWDGSKMRSSYANVCNVQSSREEVVVYFGTNQAWKGDEEEITVELTDRIILSPFAAQRLSELLNRVLEQYQSRFGPLAPRSEGAPRGAN